MKHNQKLMGVKQGMMQLFDAQGNRIVCTVIKADKHLVSQIKTTKKDGYNALQLASGKLNAAKTRNVAQPQKGHFKKAGIEPRQKMMEMRLDEVDSFKMGQELGVELFQDIGFVNVRGISKGKGHQGVMKRHNFHGMPGAHGAGPVHRHGGSCGMRTSPGRCLKGTKKSGRMGGEQVTAENLRVVKVDAAKQVIVVEGAVPGCRGGWVYITSAHKKIKIKK